MPATHSVVRTSSLPVTRERLLQEQDILARADPPAWRWDGSPITFGGVFVCFPEGGTGAGATGDPGWAAAVVLDRGRLAASAVVTGSAGAPYEPGLLALREGPLLEAAVRALPVQPDCLLVNATGRDHPRRAGLALHLGAVLDLPAVGVTRRPLCAVGTWPGERAGESSPLRLDGIEVAAWLRTRAKAHPLVVHPAWRTDQATAIAVVLATTGKVSTPEPLRQARRLAREAR